MCRPLRFCDVHSTVGTINSMRADLVGFMGRSNRATSNIARWCVGSWAGGGGGCLAVWWLFYDQNSDHYFFVRDVFTLQLS